MASYRIGGKSHRWLMLGLIWALYASFGITIGTIPPLVEPIVQDLGMNYTQMGLLLGSWQLVYIFTASPLGALVDRLGVRRSLGVGILLIWLSLVSRGLAIDFFSLLFAVALFGVGGPIISIGAPKVVALWFEEKERGMAAGIYSTAPMAGIAFALATAGSLIMPLTGNWRIVPLTYGAVLLVVIIAWWTLAREAPQSTSEARTQPEPRSGSVPRAIWELLRIRNVRLMMVLAPFTFLVSHGLNNWLPTLLQDQGMTLSQAGLWTALGTGVAAIGLLVIPRVARHGYRVLTLSVLSTISAVSIFSLPFLTGPALVASVVVSSLMRSSLTPLLTLILIETPGVGHLRIGAAAGLFFAAAEVGGFIGPFLLGFLRDAMGSLAPGILLLGAASAAIVLLLPLVQDQREKVNQ